MLHISGQDSSQSDQQMQTSTQIENLRDENVDTNLLIKQFNAQSTHAMQFKCQQKRKQQQTLAHQSDPK